MLIKFFYILGFLNTKTEYKSKHKKIIPYISY